MAGVDGVVVEWAPSIAPFATPGGGDWQTIADWVSVRTRAGKTLEVQTFPFSVGTADIVVRNGDTAGHSPTFSPLQSYKGRNIRVTEATFGTQFLGRIDWVEYHYQQTPFKGAVTLHCVDLLGNVSDGKIPDGLFPLTVDHFTHVTNVEDAVVKVLAEIGLTAVPSGEFSNQLVKAPDRFESRQDLLSFLRDILLTEGAALTVDPGTNTVSIRGRWDALRLLSSEAETPVVFTDTDPDGTTTFGYRRNNLEWSDADAEYVNSVRTKSKYLLNDDFIDENVPTDWPRVAMSRTELVTIRQGWVDANGRMWHKVYSQQYAYPKRIQFMVGGRGAWQDSMFTASIQPSLVYDRPYQVVHTPPGTDTPVTYRCAVDAIENDMDRQRWLCTLGFTSIDRWWNAYGNGEDPIELVQIGGDAEHGIGSTAIIAP